MIIKAQLPAAVQQCIPYNKATPIAYNPKKCPCCKKETMQTVMRFNRRGPPADWKEPAADLLTSIRTAEVLKNEVV